MYALINPDNSCCFSGYRPEKLPWGSDEHDPRCLQLKEQLLATAERMFLSGIRHFICGMARGCDMYFCEAVSLLREKYGEITLEAAIPYEKQASGWRETERIRYARLVGLCDHVTYVSRDYSRNCMNLRNRYMVNNASVLIAVFDGIPGGTKNTLKLAARKGLEIIKIEP